jgi:hypothetical protein
MGYRAFEPIVALTLHAQPLFDSQRNYHLKNFVITPSVKTKYSHHICKSHETTSLYLTAQISDLDLTLIIDGRFIPIAPEVEPRGLNKTRHP